MKFVATSVLIAVACFVVVAEAQKQPKIAPTQSPIKRPPFEPITGFEVVNPEPTPVTQTTLKPTTACSCGPTTLTSFTTSTLKPTNGTRPTTSTLKPTNGTRPTSRPTNGTTSWPTRPTTTRPQIIDRKCSKFEANSQTYNNLCRPPGTHTLNLFSNSIWGAACQPGFPAASTVGFTDIATILKLHNIYRQTVAQGLETQGSPAGPQPKASNMRELKWDDELACIAAAWARQCTYKHDKCRDVSRFKVGQNIYISASSVDTLGTSEWNEAVTAWYDEVQEMNPSYVSSFPASPPNVIGHYTQVVWANTYLVGCATAYYQSTAVFGSKMPYNRIYVCNYGPTGNWIGSPVYKQGSPGSACPAGPSSSYTGLCA